MFKPLSEKIFIMPVCYHPTTVISIDDDPAFTNALALELAKKIHILAFNSPSDAIEYSKNKHTHMPFTARCLIEGEGGAKLNFISLRDEKYNNNRFSEITVSVTDYDMPHISGVELMKTMEFPQEIAQYSHIILTGKVSDDFKRDIVEIGKQDDYINKDDPDYLNKLVNLIDSREKRIFQWISYVPARILVNDPNEKPTCLFDGNFANLFNKYISENNICEFYLFDKQGSYIFLDENAKPSWLFVRNDLGVNNSIARAQKYGAPKEVIDAIKAKDVILSLYEEEDFKALKHIEWDKYLLPANVLKSDSKYLHAFPNLLPEGQNEANYYYAFTDKFPGYKAEDGNVLSYKRFLDDI